jgi:hypothetical protein
MCSPLNRSTPTLKTSPVSAVFVATVFVATVFVACAGSDTVSPHEDDASTSGGATTTSCLDESQQPTNDCAVAPTGAVCERAPNPACAVLLLEEVSVSPSQGSCLRLVMRNDCGQTLYSRTCIEHRDEDDGEASWQCWWSTTLPGYEIDVGQCGATGDYVHWWGLSSGALDVIDSDCDPGID